MYKFDINFLDSDPRFSNFKKTLCETSLDDSNQCQMTKSQKEVICFDEIAKQYPVKKGFTLSSVDALFFKEQELFLVEFKNGCIVPKNLCTFGYSCAVLENLTETKIKDEIKKRESNFRNELLKKFYETILMLLHLNKNLSIEYFQNNATFIVVYNQDKNKQRDRLAKQVARGKSLQKFGLGYMTDYCCKNIYTYTQKEFEDFLQREKLFY